MRNIPKVPAHRKRRKFVKAAKGYFGARKRLYRTAREAVERAWQYQYIHRKLRKREFRRLWIIRISAAAKMCDTNYSCFMNGLKKAGVNLDRKMLADIAARDMATFENLAKMASGN